MIVLEEVTGTPRLQGEPTDPLGPVTSSSTDAHASPPQPPASVLIYCHGEPVDAPVGPGGVAQCDCGELVRVAW